MGRAVEKKEPETVAENGVIHSAGSRFESGLFQHDEGRRIE